MTSKAASERVNEIAKSASNHSISELPRAVITTDETMNTVLVFTVRALPEMAFVCFFKVNDGSSAQRSASYPLELVDHMSATNECENNLAHRHVSQMTYITPIDASANIFES